MNKLFRSRGEATAYLITSMFITAFLGLWVSAMVLMLRGRSPGAGAVILFAICLPALLANVFLTWRIAGRRSHGVGDRFLEYSGMGTTFLIEKAFRQAADVMAWDRRRRVQFRACRLLVFLAALAMVVATR